MSFLGRDPLEAEKQRQGMGANYVQSRPAAQSQPGLGSMLADTAMNNGMNMALKGPLQTASNALFGTVGTAGTAAIPATATAAAVPAVAGVPASGALGAIASSGALGASAAPMLAAMGPFAIAALPFLLKDGTSSVPNIDYGIDPLSQRNSYRDGTCSVRKYNKGSMGVKPTTNMAYADGVDSVPSMLTPGEAVIPAPAAQNPANKPAINAMINEGRAANDMAEGMPEVDMTIMAGPLSGKAKWEQMKLLQDMSFKKKAFEAEEQRKQQAFDQKMSQSEMKYMLAMRQSQE